MNASPPPNTGTLRILHLSDLHAVAAGERLFERIDTAARLERVAAFALEAALAPDLILVTGDLVHKGHAAAYPEVAAGLARLSGALDAPVVTVLGNHDDRQAARLLPGHAGRDYSVEEIRGWRIVALDSSEGRLGAAQLDWLAGELRRPAGHGTIMALHHSPVPSPLPGMKGQGLANPSDLARAVADADVRLIATGHYHHPQSALFHGIPVWTSPALSYQQIMNPRPGTVQGADAGMVSFVELGPAGVSATPYALASGPPLFTVPAGSSTQSTRTTTPDKPAPSQHLLTKRNAS